jgi:hypothetical protein
MASFTVKISKPEPKEAYTYITWAGAAFGIAMLSVVLLIIQAIWPSVFPFDLTDPLFWTPRGSPGEWLTQAWPILAWGSGVTAILAILKGPPEPHASVLDLLMGRGRPSAAAQLKAGFFVSLRAGVTEELFFRWVRWFAAIAGCLVALWMWTFMMVVVLIIGTVSLLAGDAGAKIFGFIAIVFSGLLLYFDLNPQFIHEAFVGPLADWVTLGLLHDYLFHPHSWAVGAGILASNALFRDGHKYQGLLGWVNSWFLGMYFFYVLFSFGLGAAVLIHFAYDMGIFATRALITAIRD